MPFLFVFSNGLPEVMKSLEMGHSRILLEQIQRITSLVSKKRLSVIAVEIGRVCEEPVSDWEKIYFSKIDQLMQDITGLHDKRHVCCVKDSVNLENIFSFYPHYSYLM